MRVLKGEVWELGGMVRGFGVLGEFGESWGVDLQS